MTPTEQLRARMAPCIHGVPFERLPSGSYPQCPHCDLIWHEGRLEGAKRLVAHHTAKRAEAIAAISRTCGGA